MSTPSNSRSPTPESTHEGNISQIYIDWGTSSKYYGSPLTSIDHANAEQLPFLDYSNPSRPIPLAVPPEVKNLYEQYIWLKFTRDNNKPDSYGTSSTEPGPLSLSKVAELYIERYGGTATQQAISKRLNNENNLRKFCEMLPNYPHDIIYQNKPGAKRKAEGAEEEGRNQRRKINNLQSVAGPSEASSTVDPGSSQLKQNGSGLILNASSGHEQINEEENNNTANHENCFGTFHAGWSRVGVYRPPKQLVESIYLDMNYTHLRSVGAIRDPDDEDSEMPNASEDSDESNDNDRSDNPEEAGSSNNSDDSDEDSDDDTDDSEEESSDSHTVSLPNNPRRRIDGSAVRENVVQQHRNGKVVFVLKRSADTE